YYDPETGTWY
nr:Chain A, CLN025 [synthetic construct]5AWL_A Chain A, A mutant of Chignolin, CLN025 [synthetic construct]